MLAYLGLPWDEGVLKFYETERPVRTRKVNQARKRIYRVSVGRWKNHACLSGCHPHPLNVGCTHSPE